MQVTGNLSLTRQLAQRLGRVRVDDAAADVEHRPARVGERLRGQADLLGVALRGRLVAGQVDRVDRLVRDVRAREVLRDVDQDRARAAGAGDVERLVDRRRDVARVLDHDRVLDDRHRDAGDVGLLEAVGADQVGADLAGDEDRRDRVHHRVGDRRDQVGGAGAARGERDADAAGRLGVALGRVARALLVAAQDVPDARVVEGVVGRKEAPPGIPNTVSTPSFLRHSMMASTARMVGAVLLSGVG